MYLVDFDLPGVTREQYDRVWQILGERGELAPPGRHHHFGAPVPGGWHVTDVWDDLEKLDRFAKVLMPAMASAGVTPTPPRVLPIAKVVSA